MKIQLSDHFTYVRLLRFTLPSIVMMVFTSIYSVVDGIFIANFTSVTAFAAVNFIFPLAMVFSAVGFMFGSGGSALVSKTLGEGDREGARRIFSLLVYVSVAIGLVLTLLGLVFIEPIAVWMGADEALLPYCVTYGRILMCSLMPFFLQNVFQSFLVVAEKPQLGLLVTVGAGVTNMALDALFVAVLDWGVAGAAAATALSQCVGGLVPLFFFLRENGTPLRIGKTEWDGRVLFKSCTNGASELVTNVSMSSVSMLYNYQLMRLAGEDGVAAYGAVMYVSFSFVAIFIGYSIGMAPVVGFHFGAANRGELRGLLRKSLVLMTLAGLALSAVAFAFAEPIARVFVEGETLLSMTLTAFRCFSVGILFSGFGIFGSAFFTALGDGAVSAAISFLRTLVFQVFSVLLLPLIFELNGVWYAQFTAELLATATTLYFFAAKRKKYGYV